MSGPWIAVVVCLWVLVIAMALVMTGVLRKVATELEAFNGGGFTLRQTDMGPPPGTPLPPLEVQRTDGSRLNLADLPGPFVLAVLTSHCSPCLAIADGLRAAPATMAALDGAVVLTDPDGPQRLDLGYPITVLVDPQGQAIPGLQLPGTPFAIAVGADSTVATTQLVGSPQQLVALFDTVRSAKVETSS